MSAQSPFASLERPVPSWDAAEVAGLLAAEFGLAGELTPLDGEREQNYLLVTPAGPFTVKIAGPAEPIEVLEMQHAALRHIARRRPTIQVPRAVPARSGQEVLPGRDRHSVRVLSFLDGDVLRDLPPGSVTPYGIGAAVATLQVALQGFFHPAAGRRILWDAREAPALLGVLDAVSEPQAARLERILTRFRDATRPALEALPAQVIHNDMNPDNLIAGGGSISGVIDFGDMVHGPKVMDLAVAAAYQVPDAPDATVVLTDIVAGYESVSTLTGPERAVLAELVAVRLCQSILIGAWHAAHHPGNADYLLADGPAAWRALDALEHVAWPAPVAESPEAMDRRRRVIAPGLRLSYDEPLHLASGEGVWVEDPAGRRYLDAYNNVVQVGHGHPLIAGALARQTARLNTNTRYLTDELVRYAEELTALLPDGLDVCYFTNSGSEANDLAVRMARAVTGNEGVIVTDFAYHGSTGLVAAMSLEELGDRPPPPWVATVPPPGDHDAGAAVENAAALLDGAGVAPAALVFDTIFSSDGIHDPPGSYLEESARAARNAGALFVADEVQAGLGRVGTRFWGFAAGSVTPDIVTLGKPIGNGHPMGAVVASREIAGRFADRDYFFSTFGGNTVSAVVGSTVLEITRRERLAERAEEVGEYLRSSIAGLALGGVSDVRGAGLFIGVELIDDELAAAAVEGMRQRGVLIGRTGRHDNVLKIRPPLVFERAHADVLLEALAGVLLPLEGST